MTNDKPPEKSVSMARTIGFATFGAFVLSLAVGPSLGLGGHTPFLFGLGNLPSDEYDWFGFYHRQSINLAAHQFFFANDDVSFRYKSFMRDMLASKKLEDSTSNT